MFHRAIQTLLIVLFSFGNLVAQDGFLPRKMEAEINTAYHEFNPVISYDRKILYFTRASHPENNHDLQKHFGPLDNQDIWYSRLEPTGKWTPAQRMPYPLNTAYYNSLLSILDDRKTILITGAYDKKNRWKKRGFSLSRLEGTGWSNPEQLKFQGNLKFNKGKVSNAYLSEDGDILFLSYSSKYNSEKEDIYISKKEGHQWSKPSKLPATVNNKRFSETAPFYDSREQKLYFSSNRNATIENPENYDIFYSRPTDKNLINWTLPTKLNDTINSKNWESYFKINEEGTVAFFARKEPGGTSDIYTIKLVEDNPVVEVSGTIFSNFDNEPLNSKYEFKIFVDGKILDSAVIHPQASHFVIKLPLGKKYYLSAIAKNHIPVVDSIDVTNVREYSEIEKNLFVNPVPFVVLSGKILLKNGLSPLPDSADPKIYINGKPAKYEEWNKQTGEYKINLKFGVKHQLAVKAKGFDMETASIDLTPVNKYSEIEKDFYIQKLVAPERDEAIITGQIIDKKTGKPLAEEKRFSIFANDIVAGEVNINYKTAEYKLIVPLGKRYILNATSQDYYPVYETVDLSAQKTRIKITKNLTLAPIEVGMSVKLNNIFFETGKAALKKESFPELQHIITFLQENENIKVEIGGHTDNVGNPVTNQRLSELRANAVKDYIQSKGISSERLQSKGYGTTKPVAPNTTKQGRTANRRVEFTILDK